MNKNIQKQSYVAPEVEVFSIRVEQGFVGSGFNADTQQFGSQGLGSWSSSSSTF